MGISGVYVVSHNQGFQVGGPHHTDCSILVWTLGPTYFGKEDMLTNAVL